MELSEYEEVPINKPWDKLKTPWERVCGNYEGWYDTSTSRKILLLQCPEKLSDEFCHYCYKNPCDWESYGDGLIDMIMAKCVESEDKDGLNPLCFRHKLHQAFKDVTGKGVPCCCINNYVTLFSNKQIKVKDLSKELGPDEYTEDDGRLPWAEEGDMFETA